jgi:carboxypeptidase C (cathepsin A)
MSSAQILRRRPAIGALLIACLPFWTLDAGAVDQNSQAPRRSFVTKHVTEIGGHEIPYIATVEEFIVNNKAGHPALSLFTTSYVRSDVSLAANRPVVFLFNGGPSAAAIGVHMQFGPERSAPGASAGTAAATGGASTSTSTSPAASASSAAATTRFVHNPYSLLDVADLVVFDPAETGFSRVLDDADRPYFYSTAGDCDSLAQLVVAWLHHHARTQSQVYLLGESYGSVRQVVTGSLLARRGVTLSGQIILGDSIFLTETSRRTHNIISTAVSLPLLAMTAAYHGKADQKGKTDAAFLDEVYAFALSDYLLALSKGYAITDAEKRATAERLAAYTGICADYYMAHGLTIAKQDFNRQLLAGKLLNANDTRIATPLPPPPKNQEEAQKQQAGALLDPYHRIYTDYMHQALQVSLPGLDYRVSAPGSFESWDWGPGCNDYLQSAGLCNPDSVHPSVFADYDWPEMLKRQFANPKLRVMIVAGYYDGLSSIGTHRYLAAQLGYPKDRFAIHEYAAGHMTAADPKAQPLVASEIHKFLTASP